MLVETKVEYGEEECIVEENIQGCTVEARGNVCGNTTHELRIEQWREHLPLFHFQAMLYLFEGLSL